MARKKPCNHDSIVENKFYPYRSDHGNKPVIHSSSQCIVFVLKLEVLLHMAKNRNKCIKNEGKEERKRKGQRKKKLNGIRHARLMVAIKIT